MVPPPQFRDIKRLYTNLNVAVKIGKEKWDINQEVGVRQGDSNVSSVIFLFLMSAFAETLENEWSNPDIYEAEFINTNRDAKRTTHRCFFLWQQRRCWEGIGNDTQIFSFLWPWNLHRTRRTTIKNRSYVHTQVQFLYPWITSILPPHQMSINSPAKDTTNDDEIRITKSTRIHKKKPFSTMNQKEREVHDSSPKTDRIKYHIKYLGSFISFNLTDWLNSSL